MATPQNIRYIHPLSTLSPLPSPYTSHLSPYTFLYLPIPFSPSFHPHILHSPLSPSTLSHTPLHNPLTFSIPQSPILPIMQYNAHIPTITPSLHNCPHHPIHALVTPLYSFILSSAHLHTHPIHIPHLLFHVKHIDNDSYFYFHIIYYILYNIICTSALSI